MKVKEYLKTNKILSDFSKETYAPYLTTDGQDVINNTFELELGEKELFDPETVEKTVQNVLLKNFNFYSKLDEIIKKNFLKDYTSKITEAERITDTTHNPAETLRTKTPSNTTVVSNETETVERTKFSGEKNQESGSEKTVVIDSEQAFDSSDFSNVSKNQTDVTPGKIFEKTFLNDEEKTRIPGQITTTTTLTTEDETIEVIHAETTVQKLGPYERLEDVPAQYIEQTLKALETYRMNLYDVIIQDLREVLVFSTWETSWFNL